MSRLRVVQISESAFSVKGHGVHTAFVETVRALEARDDVDVMANSFASADIRHIHTVGPYSLAQLLFATGKKVVSAHVVPDSFVGSLIGAKYWLKAARGYLRWFYNRADAVVAVSQETAAVLKDMGVTTTITVVYNMIDTSVYQRDESRRASVREKIGVDENTFVVVGNGQVQPRKRVDTFVRLARELPEMHFVWVGGLPFGKVAANHAEINELIHTAPSNVTFTGVVELDEVRNFFAAGDVFVMTSEQETFGLAIIEAAASGLPVVLRDIHDYDDTFRPDAVMASEESFASEIQRLATDNTHYLDMQKHAALIAKRFDSHEICDTLVSLYHSALRSNNGIID